MGGFKLTIYAAWLLEPSKLIIQVALVNGFDFARKNVVSQDRAKINMASFLSYTLLLLTHICGYWLIIRFYFRVLDVFTLYSLTLTMQHNYLISIVYDILIWANFAPN